MAGRFRGTKTTVKSVTVTNTATKLLDPNNARSAAVFQNMSTQLVELGTSAVTFGQGPSIAAADASGSPTVPGNVWVDTHTVDAWYAIVASGTADVRVLEYTENG